MMSSIKSRALLVALVFFSTLFVTQAFTTHASVSSSSRHPHHQLHATSNTDTTNTLSAERKRVLLSRTGPYFELDRRKGTIAFGATAQLTTPLPTTDANAITAWLWDAESLALSIWDPERTTILLSQKNVYRLQTMELQFVTLKLSPWVDVEMKTIPQSKQPQSPIFTLQSVGFDPNIQVLPGMKLNAQDLGIVIETVGYLRSSSNNDLGVSGVITFQTSGQLPPPLRLLPDAVLQAASEAINNQVVKLAVQNFSQGAQKNFALFLKKQKEEAVQ